MMEIRMDKAEYDKRIMPLPSIVKVRGNPASGGEVSHLESVLHPVR